jgi:hypothetical protein
MFKKSTILAAALLALATGSYDVAEAGNSKFNVRQMPKFICTISGPTEFRDIRITNNSGHTIRYARIFWKAKVGGKVLSGMNIRRMFAPGQTVTIPTGTGGGGYCRAHL